jgi:hypothetical protein
MKSNQLFMDKPIILYVDALNEDESIGYTESPDTISYNLKKIKDHVDSLTDLIAEYNEGTLINSFGRYIFSAMITLEKPEYFMGFFDCKKNIEIAKLIAKGEGNPQDIIKMFMSRFEELGKVYDKNYFLVKLVVGKPPL